MSSNGDGWIDDGRSSLEWFAFFARDYLANAKVRAFTTGEEHGVYLLLLLAEARDGPLPPNLDELALLVPGGREALERVWPRVGRCFVEEGGRLVNPKLERTISEALGRALVWQEAGRAGGIASARARASRAKARLEPGSSQAEARLKPPSTTRVLSDPCLSSGGPPPSDNPSPTGVGHAEEGSGEDLRTQVGADSIGGPETRPGAQRTQPSKKPPARAPATCHSIPEPQDVPPKADLEEASPDLPGCELRTVTVEGPSSQASPPRLTPDRLADLWGELCQDLPQPKRPLAPGIKATLRAAIERESGRDWAATFREVEASDFLSGRSSSDEPFAAAITWVVGPKNLAKIDAGQYRNRNGRARAPRLTFQEEALERIKAASRAELRASGDLVDEVPPAITHEEETPW